MSATTVTRGGTPYTPTYADSIDTKKCSVAAAATKVCVRDVLTLVDRGEDDEVDEDDWDDEDAKAMMT